MFGAGGAARAIGVEMALVDLFASELSLNNGVVLWLQDRAFDW